MPRQPDPDLEKRIIDAGWRLWKKGDDHLSLRALARAARTNTPAIYRRFKNRKEILQALMLRFRQGFYEVMATSPTLEDALDSYIDFALKHPREYEIFFANQNLLRQWLPGPSARFADKNPAFFWGVRKLAERFGGTPESHIPLAASLWALVHGTASLLISRALDPELESEIRAESRKAFGVLLREAAKR
jgi:AcrR family transcriptional regulator